MKVENIRRMTDEEMEREGWHYRGQNPVAFEMSNGDVIYPSQDPEGNGPGALFGRDDDGEAFSFDP